MKYWWDRFSGLEQRELDSLEEAGIAYKKDATAWSKGKLVLHLVLPINILDLDVHVEQEELILDVHYPDTYPFLKPEIFAKEEIFDRHQNPFEKNLCLVGRSTDNWEFNWRIADYLKSQLPKILRINIEGAGTEFSDFNEEHQGEPFTEYLPFKRDGEVFFIGNWRIPDGIQHGTLKIGVLETEPIRGIVLEVRDDQGKVLEKLSHTNLEYVNEMVIPWRSLSEALTSNDPNVYLEEIKKHPDYKARNNRRNIGVLIFPEEGIWKNETKGWVFIVTEPKSSAGISSRRRKKKGRGNKIVQSIVYLVRAQRADRKSFQERVPELSILENKKVLLFGLGSIGAPIALELARGGIGNIVLVDYDYAEAGPSVRWPFGMDVAGRYKCEILEEFINKNYPNVIVEKKLWRIGNIYDNEIENMNEMANNADIIIDATAEVGVQHFLSDCAIELNIPYVWAVGRPGGWGGLVGRVVPDKTEGCWLCYTHLRQDNKIVEPPSSGEAMFQPTGCADPTFFGAGFDMVTIALEGVRMVVGTLGNGAENSYPDIEGDLVSIAFRNDDGTAIPPKFTSESIPAYPNCPCCSIS